MPRHHNQGMKPSDREAGAAKPTKDEPARAPDEESAPPTLPDVPVYGREFFALSERTRPDGGPLFDAIELAPVITIDSDGTCEALESVTDVPEEDRGRIFWSFHGHTPGEGVQCLGDFTTRDDAIEALRRLLGDLKPYR
jgi:hypothetical protein